MHVARGHSPHPPPPRDNKQLDEKQLSARRCRRCAHGSAQKRGGPTSRSVGLRRRPGRRHQTHRRSRATSATPRPPAHSRTPAIARRATAQRDVEKLRRQADLDARVVVFCQIAREKNGGKMTKSGQAVRALYGVCRALHSFQRNQQDTSRDRHYASFRFRFQSRKSF